MFVDRVRPTKLTSEFVKRAKEMQGGMSAMSKVLVTKQVEISDDYIEKVLDEGIECCAEVEVGEVVSCLMTMFQNIQNTNMIQHIKQVCGPDKEDDIDQLLICIFVSEIATITANFKKREKKGGEA